MITALITDSAKPSAYGFGARHALWADEALEMLAVLKFLPLQARFFPGVIRAFPGNVVHRGLLSVLLSEPHLTMPDLASLCERVLTFER